MTGTTRETPLRDIPAEQRPLLLIASGVEVTTALREAVDLEDAVRRLLLMGTEIIHFVYIQLCMRIYHTNRCVV